MSMPAKAEGGGGWECLQRLRMEGDEDACKG